MPCAYGYNAWGLTRNITGLIPFFPVSDDKSFQRRLRWITQCAQVSAFVLHIFDYTRGNVSRYFIEVKAIYIYNKALREWGLISTRLAHPSCYYLGTFRNYWNTKSQKINFAHDVSMQDSYSIGSEPEIPGQPLAKQETEDLNSLVEEFGKDNLMNYLYPDRMDKGYREAFFAYPHGPGTDIDEAIKKMAFFVQEFDIRQWLAQKFAIDERMAQFNACILKAYPKPSREPQYKILDPQGAKDFPGIPINQIQLPAPTAQSVPRPPPKQILIKLVFAFKSG